MLRSGGMNVAVFMNADAGGAYLAPEKVGELFRHANISARIHHVRQGTLESTLDRALRERLDAVVGAGGDGTLSTIATKLVGTRIPLGVLPLGTHNHFAKDLNIPLALPDAVRCIAECPPHPVDVGDVNGRLFINNSSIGAYPQIVQAREEHRERLGLPKWIGNAFGLLKVLWRWPLMHVRLEMDGQAFTRTTPFVFVGNNEYRVNPRRERQRERVHAGELCVYTIHARNIWSLVRLFWLSLRDRLNEARDFEAFFTRQLTIRSHRGHLRVSRDGEVCRLETPLRYRIRPGALMVFSPAAEQVHEGYRAHLGPALRS